MKNYKLLSLVGIAVMTSTSVFARAERIIEKSVRPEVRESVRSATPAAKDMAKPVISESGARPTVILNKTCTITGNSSQSALPVITAAGFNATIQAQAATEVAGAYAKLTETANWLNSDAAISEASAMVTSNGQVDAQVYTGLTMLVNAAAASAAQLPVIEVKNAKSCAAGGACDTQLLAKTNGSIYQNGPRALLVKSLGEVETKKFEEAGCASKLFPSMAI